MSKIKILLVDDRPDNLVSIEAILSNKGYEFVKANSGRQALKVLLNEHDFTLILMDVKMPDLNGFETATLISEREKLRHIPIIFITAFSHSDEKVYEGYTKGGVDYIYKPINPELLKAKVGVFVDLYKKNHMLLEQEQKLISINKNLEEQIRERENSELQIKELNNKLIQNIQTLEATNTELARFAYVASHDLQEPLRKIQIYIDILRSKYGQQLDEEGQGYLERIKSGSGRLQKLIKDILSYSKLNIEEDVVPTDVNNIIKEIVSDLDLNKKASFELEPLPELNVHPGRIRQLFQNLIVNSIKFRKDEETPAIKISHCIVKLKVLRDEKEVEETFCNIQFQDNGIGFEPRYSDQIFTLFKRLNDNTVYEGTGIGLAICKKIVEQHKGFISATGEPNIGAVFNISLPLKVNYGKAGNSKIS